MSGRVFQPQATIQYRDTLIRVGTRASPLALAQSTQIAEIIARRTGYDVALVAVSTVGDRSAEPLTQLGGSGVFVSALREALLAGDCDIAVHSCKDLPTGECGGITLGAVSLRADPRDAWCSRQHVSLAALPPGSIVGTGSPRRAAQLTAIRPDLKVKHIRGNVDSRLSRITRDVHAVVLASAGLDRLGREADITERLPLELVPPAPGQGALVLEVRTAAIHASLIAAALQAVHHRESWLEVLAERELLAALEAGCAAPVAAIARVSGSVLRLQASVYRSDGTAQIDSYLFTELHDAVSAEQDARTLGQHLAHELLQRGAAELAGLGRQGTPL